MAYKKPVIVAEIGINHNGSLAMAKNLIALAKNYGADYVKFQKRTPRLCVPEDQKQQRRLTVFGPMTYLEYKERLEFGREEYDGYVLGVFVFLEDLAAFVAVHLRHHDVKDDDVRGIVFCKFNRFSAIIRICRYPDARFTVQGVFQGLPHEGVVIGQQD